MHFWSLACIIRRMFSELSHAQIQWLTDKDSLTARLKQFTQDRIQFHVLYNHWENDDWVRRIEWRCDQQTWITGLVIIPKKTLHANNNELMQVREKPIGEILFQDKNLTRSEFTFKQLGEKHWQRTSTFYFRENPLCVTETFLPAFFSACLNHTYNSCVSISP